MPNRFAKYDDYEVVAKPVKVPFETKSGKTVYVKAIKTSLRKRKARPHTNGK